MQQSVLPQTLDALGQLSDQIVSGVEKDLKSFLQNANVALWNSDEKVHTTFTTTVSIKKKVVADEVKISLEINSRERIPKPIVKHDLDFDSAQQLVML